jgi:cadmium resistance protein CadD (predicted permease)
MFARIKNFVKSNWSFGTLVLVPIARLLWRVFIGDGKKPNSSRSSSTISGDTYKKGDVIDIEVKK